MTDLEQHALGTPTFKLSRFIKTKILRKIHEIYKKTGLSGVVNLYP